MAKGSRSKIRKFWASERRKALGVPVERKQLEEQQAKLKASLDQQQNAESILKLKTVLNPRAKRGGPEVTKMEVPPAAEVDEEVEQQQEEEEEEEGVAKMDVDKSVHRPVSKRTRGKKRVSKLPPKKLCEFK